MFGSVLVQRLRDLTAIKPKLDGRHVFAAMTLCPADTMPWAGVDLCWARVADDGPALDQRWFDVSCLPGTGVSQHVRVPALLTR